MYIILCIINVRTFCKNFAPMSVVLTTVALMTVPTYYVQRNRTRKTRKPGIGDFGMEIRWISKTRSMHVECKSGIFSNPMDVLSPPPLTADGPHCRELYETSVKNSYLCWRQKKKKSITYLTENRRPALFRNVSCTSGRTRLKIPTNRWKRSIYTQFTKEVVFVRQRRW